MPNMNLTWSYQTVEEVRPCANATAGATVHLHVKTGMFDRSLLRSFARLPSPSCPPPSAASCYLPVREGYRPPGRMNRSRCDPNKEAIVEGAPGTWVRGLGGRGSAMFCRTRRKWLNAVAWLALSVAIVLVLTCMRFEISFSNGKGAARKNK